MNNEERLNYQLKILMAEKLRPMLKNYRENFINVWYRLMGRRPPEDLVEEFIHYIIKVEEKSMLKYTQKQVTNMTAKFMFLKSNYYR